MGFLNLALNINCTLYHKYQHYYRSTTLFTFLSHAPCQLTLPQLLPLVLNLRFLSPHGSRCPAGLSSGTTQLGGLNTAVVRCHSHC